MARAGDSWANGTNQTGLAREEAAPQGSQVSEVKEVAVASGERVAMAE